MMMHQDTKFDDKMFGSLKDIIWANTDILTLLYFNTHMIKI